MKEKKMYRNGNNKVECIAQEKKTIRIYIQKCIYVHTHPDEVSATVLCNSILSVYICTRLQEKEK